MLPQPTPTQPWDSSQTANLLGNIVENTASFMQDASLDTPITGADPSSTELGSQTYTPFHTAATGAASIPGHMEKTQQITGMSYDPSSFLRDLTSEPTSQLDPNQQRLASNINLLRSMTRGAPDTDYSSSYSSRALEQMGHPNIRSLVEETIWAHKQKDSISQWKTGMAFAQTKKGIHLGTTQWHRLGTMLLT